MCRNIENAETGPLPADLGQEHSTGTGSVSNELLSAHELWALIEPLAQAVWETDANGQVVRDSPTWRAYTGQTLEKWLEEGWAL